MVDVQVDDRDQQRQQMDRFSSDLTEVADLICTFVAVCHGTFVVEPATPMTQLIHRSYAKVNLGLRILGKRSDGFHDIESIFVAVDLADTITVSPSDQLQVECSPSVTAAIEENLVYRAANALARVLPREKSQSAKITVTKTIPTGAGLGGGSGNAATTLLALFELWMNRPPSESEIDSLLQPIALSLGSDVPFFLRSGAAYVTGRGENITPLNVDLPWHILLVLPGIHVDTGWAYAQVSGQGKQQLVGLDQRLKDLEGDLKGLSGGFKNDFEPAVAEHHPQLKTIRDRLEATGAAYVSMSGSGSTMYAIYPTRNAALDAKQQCGNWTTYICSPIRT